MFGQEMSRVVLIILLFSSIFASTTNSSSIDNKRVGVDYDYTPNIDYQYMDRLCSKNCREGGCRFRDCDHISEEHSNITDGSLTCDGGLCEFINCFKPSCRGGACTFIGCTDASCYGGGCHHVHPRNTLKESYCDGGGCRLNGKPLPSNLRNYLSR